MSRLPDCRIYRYCYKQLLRIKNVIINEKLFLIFAALSRKYLTSPWMVSFSTDSRSKKHALNYTFLAFGHCETSSAFLCRNGYDKINAECSKCHSYTFT